MFCFFAPNPSLPVCLFFFSIFFFSPLVQPCFICVFWRWRRVDWSTAFFSLKGKMYITHVERLYPTWEKRRGPDPAKIKKPLCHLCMTLVGSFLKKKEKAIPTPLQTNTSIPVGGDRGNHSPLLQKRQDRIHNLFSNRGWGRGRV